MKYVVLLMLAGALISAIVPDRARAEDDMDTLPALHTLWDYFQPAESRARFETIRPQAEQSGDREYYLSLLTQIARTYGLEGNFDQAHALLDTVASELSDSMPVANVNYLLERGRAYRSGGDPAKGLPLFTEAFDLAAQTHQDYLAIDAAHMVALATDSAEERMAWSMKGISLAESSSDPRARHWLGSICNNVGWDYHERGAYDSALTMFERALAAREEEGDQQTIDIAKWCIGRTYRSLGRIDDALAIQTALRAAHDSAGTDDGYVREELGELYLLKDDSTGAAEQFRAAYRLLSQDTWLMNNESERMARMKRLGGVTQED